ncbi:MAG TPA: hypothetical protein VM187_09620, partial [Niastella sp.]|nr:hypothetical protein [Niastella sp.]
PKKCLDCAVGNALLKRSAAVVTGLPAVIELVQPAPLTVAGQPSKKTLNGLCNVVQTQKQ